MQIFVQNWFFIFYKTDQDKWGNVLVFVEIWV